MLLLGIVSAHTISFAQARPLCAQSVEHVNPSIDYYAAGCTLQRQTVPLGIRAEIDGWDHQKAARAELYARMTVICCARIAVFQQLAS